jgi:transposase InsO family protein
VTTHQVTKTISRPLALVQHAPSLADAPDPLELQSAVFEYIEASYNRQRRHSTLNMLSPGNYEQLRLSPFGS